MVQMIFLFAFQVSLRLKGRSFSKVFSPFFSIMNGFTQAIPPVAAIWQRLEDDFLSEFGIPSGCFQGL